MQQLELDVFDIAEAIVSKELRPYQQLAIDETIKALQEDFKRICLVMPTGAGKSFTVARLIGELDFVFGIKPREVLALVPRRKLKKQLANEFKANGIDPRIVHTAQSITDTKIENGYFQMLSVLILDECHELAWWNYTDKIQSLNRNIITIGLTATPDRLSKKEFIEDKFDKVINTVTFGDLVADGFLCNPTYFRYGNKLKYDEIGIDVDGGFIQEQLDRECEKQNFNESVVHHLVDHKIGTRKSIIFCSSVKQSKKLVESLNKVGITSVHVDGSMNETSQEDAISRLSKGEFSALSCAKLLIAGFDEPSIDTVVLATATNSKAALIQMCGRGSRLHPDKDEFWVFDFGDNFARNRIGLKQRFPYKTRAEMTTFEPGMKACPQCGHLNWGFARVCKECEYMFPPKDKDVQNLLELDLIEFEADLEDLRHIKQIRSIMRESYKRGELPFLAISRYCDNNRVVPKTVFNRATTVGAIFKHKNLESLCDYVFYVDENIKRLSEHRLTEKEKLALKNDPLYNKEGEAKTHKIYINEVLKMLPNLSIYEFGSKFLNSYVVNTHFYSGKWTAVLGVMPIDSKETMLTAYKRRWKTIHSQVEKLVNFTDGEINPDGAMELLSNPKSPEMRALRNEIIVLEWALRYVNLIYP